MISSKLKGYIYNKLPIDIQGQLPIIKILGKAHIALITPTTMPSHIRDAIQLSSPMLTELPLIPEFNIQPDKYSYIFDDLLSKLIDEDKALAK